MILIKTKKNTLTKYAQLLHMPALLPVDGARQRLGNGGAVGGRGRGCVAWLTAPAEENIWALQGNVTGCPTGTSAVMCPL